jgi:TetR/AcrR family transcriptional repressor of nem operon
VVGGVDRREQLVQAAFERVAEIGFEGLRLRQVAEQVGIDHSTLHHHFATKQALIAAVAEYTTRQFWSTASDAPSPASALREHLDALRRLMTDRPELFAVSAELDLRARRDPEVAAALAGHERGWRELLTGMLRSGPSDPAVEAELVIAAVKGVRLTPEGAGPVFERLTALLTEPEEERA